MITGRIEWNVEPKPVFYTENKKRKPMIRLTDKKDQLEIVAIFKDLDGFIKELEAMRDWINE